MTTLFYLENLKINVKSDDFFFIQSFENGGYWDINTLRKIKEYIPSNKNIIEIGGHIGTSSMIYSQFTVKEVHVFEPQKEMYNILLTNISQNNLTNIKPYNKAIFYKEGKTKMDNENTHQIDTRGVNRGGIGLGISGEEINTITLDSLMVDSGFIHIDAQGAEQGIFYGGQKYIEKHTPTILYEDNINNDKNLVTRVNQDTTIPDDVKNFDIDKFLISLGYTIYKKWSGIDTLAIYNKKETVYCDLPANGLGCHITSVLLTSGYAKKHNKEIRYKPFPKIHHNNNNKKYNEEIENLFNYKKLGLVDNKSEQIDYNSILADIDSLPDEEKLNELRSLFNKNNDIYPVYEWVIHIRRNDINQNQNQDRYIDIDYYNKIITKIRQIYNGVIQVFTDGSKKDLQDLKDENIKIDMSKNSLDIFCKMVYCKNLVVGWSSFSYSAGLYNKNNVYSDILFSKPINYYHPIPTYWKSFDNDNVAIVGMCKNVSEYLDKVFTVIDKISYCFNKTYLYIYTNDNTDNTLCILEEYLKTSKFNDFKICIENDIVNMNRADLTIMVYGRNKCLDYARNNNVDYMVVVDMDDELYDYDMKTLIEMKKLVKNNACVSSAEYLDNFYDKFSFRNEHIPNCIWSYSCHKFIHDYKLKESINKVDSYFGGLCMYNMKYIPDEAKYNNKDKRGFYCCEHVAFNEFLKGDKLIYVINNCYIQKRLEK